MDDGKGAPGHTAMQRILIVEDSDSDYLLLARQVGKSLHPCACVRAGNRSELVSALAQSWDLIITDFHLPDIEGQELVTTIAAARPDTPCLLLSGSMEGLDRVGVPSTVFRIMEKGDNAGLQAALLGSWR